VTRRDDFDELVGGGLEGVQRERLMRVHEQLIAAGPPPELPPSLALPPGSRARADVVHTLPRGIPRRRLAASLVLAAALALAAFGSGYLVGDRRSDQAFETDFVLAMRGTDAAPGAIASLVVGEKDDDDNWPMVMTVRGLPTLDEDERYELLLTRGGKPIASCGTFRILDDKTVVYLNAPYPLRRYEGWVVTRAGSDEILVRTDEI
jgi:hypothetical protein